MDSPRVSVAISTYQRADRLPALIEALEGQTLPASEFEVVIADNGSTDGTAATLAGLATRTPLHLRTVRVERNRGPAVGRNAAWRAASAPVVAFTDDDCLPQPGWLAGGLAALGDDDAVVVGRTTPPPDEEALATVPFSRAVRVEDARFFQTCNIFFRRAHLERVGGFDEVFDQPAGEDTDLALRVCEIGAEARFASDALVHHPVRPASLSATLRETLRWTGIPRVIARHPEQRNRLLHQRWFWKRSHPTAALALVGLTLVGWRPAALALLLPWLRHRWRVEPVCHRRRLRLTSLPGTFVVDVLEVVVMLRGSLRARTIVL